MSIKQRVLAASVANRKRILISFIIDELNKAPEFEGENIIQPRSRFEELGLDSMRAVEFKETLEQQFQCQLRTTLIFDYPTPESLAEYLCDCIVTSNVESEPQEETDNDIGADEIRALLNDKFTRYQV